MNRRDVLKKLGALGLFASFAKLGKDEIPAETGSTDPVDTVWTNNTSTGSVSGYTLQIYSGGGKWRDVSTDTFTSAS